MNQAHLQLSMSRQQGFYQSKDPYLVALDTVESYYGTGESTFYFNEPTFNIEVPKRTDKRNLSFYMSGKVWVRTKQIEYNVSDGLDLAIRLDEDFGEKPYNSSAWGRYDAFYSSDPTEETTINSYEFMPSYELNINTILTVPSEKDAIIYFLVCPLRPVFEEGDVFVIDGASLSCIQIDDYVPMEACNGS